MIKIAESNGKIKITSPYNPEYTAKIKAAGAKWDAAAKAWTMDARAIETARKILSEVYGEDDRGGDKVTVRVTVGEKDVKEIYGPITVLGRIVAQARSRDGGAKVGDGVVFTSGSPESGGSRNNPATIIPAGTVFEMYDVPAALLEAAEIPADYYSKAPLYTIEAVGEKAPDIEALKLERERLMARIAEIDEILCGEMFTL